MLISAYMNIDESMNIFKALSDKTRIRILHLIIRADRELCVCELMDSLHEPQYNVSRHLKALKIARLIQGKKNGRWVYYSLNDGKDKFYHLIYQIISGIRDEVISGDNELLKARLSLREASTCSVGIGSKVWEKTMNRLIKNGIRIHDEKD